MDGCKDYTRVLAALRNKPLIGLTLSSAMSVPPFPIQAEHLAPVINTVPGQSLNELSLINCLLDDDFRFFLQPVDGRSLDVGALGAITHLTFSSLHRTIWYGWLFGLLTLYMLPNLIRVSFTQVHSTYDFEKYLYIDAILRFLALADHENGASARLEFRIKRVRGSCIAERVCSSSEDWCNRINIEIRDAYIHGNDYHLQPETFPKKDHWQRTLRRNNVTALITYDKD